MAVRVEHRIGIAAPAHEVWNLVGELDGWKDWKPMVLANAVGETGRTRRRRLRHGRLRSRHQRQR